MRKEYQQDSARLSLHDKWNAGKWIFKDIYNLGYPFVHIHPHKQKVVEYLIENSPSWVTHIIIFGSSVGTWHLYHSDLDVCLIGSDTLTTQERQNMSKRDIRYNFLYYKSINEILDNIHELNDVQGEIARKGVMVYEQAT